MPVVQEESSSKGPGEITTSYLAALGMVSVKRQVKLSREEVNQEDL